MSEKKGIKYFLSKIKLIDKIKSKKYTSYVIAVVLSLIVVVIFLSSFGKKTQKSAKQNNYEKSTLEVQSYSEMIENKLVNVLSFVKGCGSVKAMVVTKSTNIGIIETQTEEKQNGSGTTKTNSPVYEKNGSQETPFVSSYTYPEIIGVLVVAEGAGDAGVKLRIINAIVSVLGIDASKIEVLEGK